MRLDRRRRHSRKRGLCHPLMSSDVARSGPRSKVPILTPSIVYRDIHFLTWPLKSRQPPNGSGLTGMAPPLLLSNHVLLSWRRFCKKLYAALCHLSCYAPTPLIRHSSAFMVVAYAMVFLEYTKVQVSKSGRFRGIVTCVWMGWFGYWNSQVLPSIPGFCWKSNPYQTHCPAH